MTKFPIMLYNTKNTKKALVPPIPPPSSYEDAVGWSAIEAGYKTALRGSRKFTREAVLYDLYSEVNNVRLWRGTRSCSSSSIRSCRRSSARYSSTVHLRVCTEKAPSELPSTYSMT